MFGLHITRITLRYADCPVNGLPAVDWRRARNLTQQPDNVAGVFDPYKFDDEALCRYRPELLDEDADLVIEDRSMSLAIADCHVLLALPLHILPEHLTMEVRSALCNMIAAWAKDSA